VWACGRGGGEVGRLVVRPSGNTKRETRPYLSGRLIYIIIILNTVCQSKCLITL